MFLENDFDFGFGDEYKTFGHSLRSHTINNWIPLAVAAVTAAGAIASSLAAGDAPEGYEPEILPKTVSGNVMQDLDFLFDQEAAESMKSYTAQLTEWGESDRAFFNSQFQPFQSDLISTNQAMLPIIEKNSTTALDQNVKDLLGSEHLKESFRVNITGTGADISTMASSFAESIANIPGEEQRVGEAISAVEKTFGQAGKELKRAMNAKGIGVSQASQRDLAISKAEAKAGAVGVAGEAARREKLQATAEGVGVLSSVQSAQSNQLLGQQASTQTGAVLTPQVGGVAPQQALSKASEVGAGLLQSGAEKMLGQRTATASAEFTQKGIQDPLFMSEDTQRPVYSTGEELAKPPPPKPRFRAAAPVDRFNRGRDGMPGSGGGNAPGGVGMGLGDGSGGSGGVGVGSVGGDD
jgi:hypothetical protein